MIEKITDQAAVVRSQDQVLWDEASALDLIMNVQVQTGCPGVALDKQTVSEDFFRLNNGVAGGILQKFVNYRMKLAIFGDFSVYSSRPLLDFIRESNQGTSIFFVSTEQEAIAKLSQG